MANHDKFSPAPWKLFSQSPEFQALPPTEQAQLRETHFKAFAPIEVANAYAEKGLPPEVGLAITGQESSWNPNARSPKGAYGLSQLMEATARKYGVNRNDVGENIAGGAAVFADEYKRFGGDLPKALAAYNAGAGAVSKAIQKGGDQWLAYMPAETRDYIPKVLAKMANVGGENRSGIFAQLPNSPQQGFDDAETVAQRIFKKKQPKAKGEEPFTPIPWNVAIQTPEFQALSPDEQQQLHRAHIQAFPEDTTATAGYAPIIMGETAAGPFALHLRQGTGEPTQPYTLKLPTTKPLDERPQFGRQVEVSTGEILPAAEVPQGQSVSPLDLITRLLQASQYSPTTATLLGPTGQKFDAGGGAVATEKSITVEDNRLNKGKPTNIPLLVPGQPDLEGLAQGREPTREEVGHAIAWAAQRGGFPGFNSIEEAVAAAKQRSDEKGQMLASPQTGEQGEYSSGEIGQALKTAIPQLLQVEQQPQPAPSRTVAQEMAAILPRGVAMYADAVANTARLLGGKPEEIEKQAASFVGPPTPPKISWFPGQLHETPTAGQPSQLSRNVEFLQKKGRAFTARHPEWFAQSKESQEDVIRNAWAEGGPSTVNSVLAMIPGFFVGGVPGMATSGATLFGLSEYQAATDEIDAFNKAHPNDQIPKELASKIKLLRAGSEAGLEFASTLIGGKLLGLDKLSGITKQAILKSAFTPTVLQALARLSGTTAAEVGTEMATAGIQAHANRLAAPVLTAEQRQQMLAAFSDPTGKTPEPKLPPNFAANTPTPWEAAKGALGPSLFQSVLMFGLGNAVTQLQSRGTLKAFSDPQVPPEKRMQAAQEIGQALQEGTNDANFVKNFLETSAIAIQRGDAMPLDVSAEQTVTKEQQKQQADMLQALRERTKQGPTQGPAAPVSPQAPSPTAEGPASPAAPPPAAPASQQQASGMKPTITFIKSSGEWLVRSADGKTTGQFRNKAAARKFAEILQTSPTPQMPSPAAEEQPAPVTTPSPISSAPQQPAPATETTPEPSGPFPIQQALAQLQAENAALKQRQQAEQAPVAARPIARRLSVVIKELGGIAPSPGLSGEIQKLRSTKEGSKLVPGVFRSGGNNFDDPAFLSQLEQAGFNIKTSDDLWAALEQEAAGQRVYPVTEGAPLAAQEAEQQQKSDVQLQTAHNDVLEYARTHKLADIQEVTDHAMETEDRAILGAVNMAGPDFLDEQGNPVPFPVPPQEIVPPAVTAPSQVPAVQTKGPLPETSSPLSTEQEEPLPWYRKPAVATTDDVTRDDYDRAQKAVDDRLDELEKEGLSPSQADKHPSVIPLYERREAIGQKLLEESHAGLMRAVQSHGVPEKNARDILKEVYSVDLEPGGQYVAGKYTKSLVPSRVRNRERIFNLLYFSPDEEGVPPETRVMYGSSTPALREKIFQQAQAVEQAVYEYFYGPEETPAPAPFKELPPPQEKPPPQPTITPADIHALAKERNIPSDDDPNFAKWTNEKVKKEHLDDMTPAELTVIADALRAGERPRQALPAETPSAATPIISPRTETIDQTKINGFTTSQGSTYQWDGLTSQRTKTPHLGQDPKDVGLQPRSARTIFVDSETASLVGQHLGLNRESQPRVFIQDNELVLTNRYGEGWQKERRQAFPFTTTPAVNLAPIEFWNNGSVHPGNRIVSLQQNAPSPATPPPSTEPTSPILANLEKLASGNLPLTKDTARMMRKALGGVNATVEGNRVGDLDDRALAAAYLARVRAGEGTVSPTEDERTTPLEASSPQPQPDTLRDIAAKVASGKDPTLSNKERMAMRESLGGMDARIGGLQVRNLGDRALAKAYLAQEKLDATEIEIATQSAMGERPEARPEVRTRDTQGEEVAGTHQEQEEVAPTPTKEAPSPYRGETASYLRNILEKDVGPELKMRWEQAKKTGLNNADFAKLLDDSLLEVGDIFEPETHVGLLEKVGVGYLKVKGEPKITGVPLREMARRVMGIANPDQLSTPTPTAEKTEAGTQYVMPGTPGRAMPNAPIRAKGPTKGTAGLDLFEPERVKQEVEQEKAQGDLPLPGRQQGTTLTSREEELAALADADLDALVDNEVAARETQSGRKTEEEPRKTALELSREVEALRRNLPPVPAESRKRGTLSPSQLADLDRLEEIEASARTTRSEEREQQGKAVSVPTATEALENFAKHGISASKEAAEGLFQLFGGKNRLGSGPTFDEETYQKAKPHFQQMWRDTQAAGQDLRAFANAILDTFSTKIAPYLKRFLHDTKTALTQPAAEEPAAAASQQVANWVLERIRAGQPFTNQQLFDQADIAFGGTQGQGTYESKAAYDAMEMGVNQWIAQRGFNKPGVPATVGEQLKELQRAMALLPTQSRRTAEQDEFQQFSTPPTEAYVASWVANLSANDTVLEPSAGVGGLAIFAKNVGAQVVVNELSPRRAALLRQMGFDQVYTENAEQLHNILPADVKPTVILMNPPFSATAGRMQGQRKTENAIAHVEQALKRLEPDGRLVAIVGQGMNDSAPAFRDWWQKIKGQYRVRANISIPGKEYAKYGTTFGNQLVVIDNEGPTFHNETKTGTPTSLLEALSLLEGVRNDRPSIARSGKPLTDQPTRETAPAPGRGEPRREQPVSPPTPLVGGGEQRRVAAPKIPGRPSGLPGDTLETQAEDRVPVPLSLPGTPTRGATDRGERVTGEGRGEPRETPLAGAPISDSGAEQPARGGLAESATSTQPDAAGVAPAELTESVYEPYRLAKLRVSGAVPHVSPLVQSAAMASVDPPAVTYTPHLPKEMIASGKISDAQLEAVTYAGQAHERLLPNGERQGIFIGDGCVAAGTRIFNPLTGEHTPIESLVERGLPHVVLSLTKLGFVPRWAHCPFMKGEADLFRVTLASGRTITVTDEHRFLTLSGWKTLKDGLHVGARVALAESAQFLSLWDEIDAPQENVPNCSDTPEDCLDDYSPYPPLPHVCGDEQFHRGQDTVLVASPLPVDVLGHTPVYLHGDGRELSQEHIHHYPLFDHLSRNSFSLVETRAPSFDFYSRWDRVRSIEFVKKDVFYDMYVPGPENYVAEGIVNHNTGLGKGRENAAIILDNWNQGRKKAVWVSLNAKLLQDAQRDVEGIGDDPAKIFSLPAKANVAIPQSTGILFTTYDTLASQSQPNRQTKEPGKTRLAQLTEWLGKDFDGVIILDEAHSLANALDKGGGGRGKSASQRALTGLDLQRQLPKARVVYVSATGATEVSNLAYAERLGLWGEGTPFADVTDFINKISEGGLAAMELVARDMKAKGLYLSRSLSFDGVTYETLEHPLTEEQRDIYNTLARAWQTVLQNMNQALNLTGAKNSAFAKRNALNIFWSGHQRFFNQILTSLQMPSVIRRVQQDLANGDAVVMQIVNTLQAAQDRKIAAMEASPDDEGQGLEALDLTPREGLMDLITRGFPVQQYEEYLDENGNQRSRAVVDSQGNPVNNVEAVAMREKLLGELGSVRVPEGPLEILFNTFGENQVAEVTGRTQRVLRDATGKAVRQSLSSKKMLADAKAFMDDKKRILIFSNAGGTGQSYHADLSVPNQRKRRHYLLQPGWQADRAVQGMGRTHRTNEAAPPHYVLVTTDVKGQKRFISSIARRLDQLGSLTRGQRQTGGQGLLSARDNLESQYAKDAVDRFWIDLVRGNIENLDLRTVLTQMGLLNKVLDASGRLQANLPPITQFLNRVLSLDLETQNAVFDAFSERLDRNIAQAIADGSLDVGMESLKAKSARVVQEQPVYTDPQSGSTTNHVELELTHDREFTTFDSARQRGELIGFYQQPKSQRLSALYPAASRTTETGRIEQRYFSISPTSTQVINQAEFEKLNPIEEKAARSQWEQVITDTSPTYTTRAHMLTGALLPIWDRLPSNVRVVRTQTADGKRYLGRLLNENDIDTTLENLGVSVSLPKVTPAEVLSRILEDNAVVELVNGWTLKRSRVGGEPRLEVIGASFREEEGLVREGAFTERIQYSTRLFLPTGDQAEAVMKRVLSSRPVKRIRAAQQSAEDILLSQQVATETKLTSDEPRTVKEESVQYGAAPQEAPVFYSSLRRAIELSKQEKFSPSQAMEGQSLFERGLRYAEPKTRAEAVQQGQDVIADLARPVQVSALKGTLPRTQSGVRTLAIGIAEQLYRQGRVDLRGQQIRSLEDLAVLARVFRDKRLETFRIFYVQDGKIVAHEGVSSRLPDEVTVFSPGKMKQEVTAIQSRIARLRASNPQGGPVQYYLLHNHPGGVPKPSREDIKLTRAIARRVPGFAGHTVLDFDTYGVIPQSITDPVTVKSLPQSVVEGEDRLATPAIPHDLLNAPLMGPEGLARIGKMLQTPDAFVTLLYRDARGVLRAIQEMPIALFQRGQDAADFIRGRVREFGAPQVLAYYGGSQDLNAAGEGLIENGTLTDMVTGDGESLQEQGGAVADPSLRYGRPDVPSRYQVAEEKVAPSPSEATFSPSARAGERGAVAMDLLTAPVRAGRYMGKGIRKTFGHRSMELEAQLGGGKGKAAFAVMDLHAARVATQEVEVMETMSDLLTHPELRKVMNKIMPLRWSSGWSRFLRSFGPTARLFGVPAWRQNLLFDSAESIKTFINGIPEFGTRIFEKDPDTKQLILDANGDPIMKEWRFTPDQGKALWAQLNDQEKAAVQYWVETRDVIKAIYNIHSELEGYMHHYWNKGFFEGLGTMLGIRLRKKKAGARIARQAEEGKGFEKDFERSIIKVWSDLIKEDEWNQMVKRLVPLVTEPIGPEGVKDGWTRIEKTMPTRRGTFVGQLGGGRQIPTDLYNEMIAWGDQVKDATVPARIARATGSYIAANLLLHVGTTTANIVGSGIQYATFVLDSFSHGLTTGQFRPFVDSTLAPFLSLLPSQVNLYSPELLGSRSGLISQFEDRNRAEQIFGGLLNLTMGTVDNYVKRSVAIAVGRSLGLPTTQSAILAQEKAYADLRRAVDTFGLDYNKINSRLAKFRSFPYSRWFSPYVTYKYKILQLMGHYFAAFHPGAEMEVDPRFKYDTALLAKIGARPQDIERVSRLITLGIIFSLLHSLYPEEKEKTGKHISKMPMSLDRTGMVKVGETEEGKEWWWDPGGHPWFAPFLGERALVRWYRNGDSPYKELLKIIGLYSPSAGPLIQGVMAAAAEQKEPDRTPFGPMIASALKPLMPLGRMAEGVRRLEGGPELKSRTFTQELAEASLIPIPDEWIGARDIITDPVTKETIMRNPTFEQRKFWAGMFLREIDPRRYSDERYQMLRRAIDRVDSAQNFKEHREAMEDVREIDYPTWKKMQPSQDPRGIILEKQHLQLIEDLKKRQQEKLKILGPESEATETPEVGVMVTTPPAVSAPRPVLEEARP